MLAPPAAAVAQEAPQALQEGVVAEETALAKQSQNPVGDLISLPFQSNNFFNIGDNDRTRSILNIQPVIPFNVGPVNIVTRTILPAALPAGSRRAERRHVRHQ